MQPRRIQTSRSERRAKNNDIDRRVHNVTMFESHLWLFPPSPVKTSDQASKSIIPTLDNAC